MNDTVTSIDFAAIPPDFPRPTHLGAVSGTKLKMLLVRFEGKFYIPGCTPPELYRRWDTCEDLAQQLSKAALTSKQGKRADMTETEILAQYLPRLLQTGWGSPEEMQWIIKRTAAILEWQIPDL